MSAKQDRYCTGCGYMESECQCDVDDEDASRELTDIDVRHPEDEAGTEIPGTDIEFATFCEGEYVESVILSRQRAIEIRDELTRLLAECPG